MSSNREKVAIAKELLAPINMDDLVNICDACEEICYDDECYVCCFCNYMLCEKCRFPPEEDVENKRCVCGNFWP